MYDVPESMDLPDPPGETLSPDWTPSLADDKPDGSFD